jgi:hypothetical protein
MNYRDGKAHLILARHNGFPLVKGYRAATEQVRLSCITLLYISTAKDHKDHHPSTSSLVLTKQLSKTQGILKEGLEITVQREQLPCVILELWISLFQLVRMSTLHIRLQQGTHYTLEMSFRTR